MSRWLMGVSPGGEQRDEAEPRRLFIEAGMTGFGATWPFATGLVKVGNPTHCSHSLVLTAMAADAPEPTLMAAPVDSRGGLLNQ